MISKLKKISAKLSMIPEFIKVNIKNFLKSLPQNQKTIVFTLDDSRLYRDMDGMGRYAYLILKLFNDGGYTIYLHKKINFLTYTRLGKYGRLIYLIENLKVVSKIPKHTQSMIYAFDTVYNEILNLSWKKTTYVNLFRPLSCQLGEVLPVPYFMHPTLYKYNQQAKIPLLRNTQRKLRIFFGGNTALYYSFPTLAIYGQMTRMQGIEAVAELEEKVNSNITSNELESITKGDQYINKCYILRTDNKISVPMTEWLDLIAKSDFFLCLSGTDLPMCHNAIEAMALGTIPILSYPDWFFPTLEHKKNAIIYSGKEDMLTKINEVFNMSEAEITQMRKNVIEYYDTYLGAKNFISKYDSSKSDKNTIILHYRLIPTFAENREGEITMKALKNYFKDDFKCEQITATH
jgi:hypothetical protein